MFSGLEGLTAGQAASVAEAERETSRRLTFAAHSSLHSESDSHEGLVKDKCLLQGLTAGQAASVAEAERETSRRVTFAAQEHVSGTNPLARGSKASQHHHAQSTDYTAPDRGQGARFAVQLA